MVHAALVLRGVVNTLRLIREQTGSPVHALVWGVWGNGKPFSAKAIARENRDVYYYKVPAVRHKKIPAGDHNIHNACLSETRQVCHMLYHTGQLQSCNS